jgi:hypothetical protein
MSTLRGLTIDLAANVARLSSDLGKAQHMLEGFGRNAKNILTIAAGGFVGREILEGINTIIDKGKEWEASNNRIIGVLRATGNAAGVTKREIEEMAESLSHSTLADDDAVKGVAATLLKFGNIQQDVFRRAVKDSLDLAGVMGNDVAGASQKLGQSLASPSGGLRGLQQEIGKLNPLQLQTIAHFEQIGDLGSAQAEILKIVESRVQGLAEQMNTGLTKSTTDTTKAWNEFLQALARTQAVSGASGFRGFLTDSLKDMKRIIEDGDWVDKLKAIGLFAAGFRGMDIPKKTGDVAGESPGERAALEVAAENKRREESRALILANAQKTMGAWLSSTRAFGQQQVAMEQAIGQRRTEVLELYQSQSLISIADYFRTRQEIQRAGLEAEVTASSANIAKLFENLRTPGLIAEPSARIEAENALNAELAKREELYKRLAFLPVETTMKQQIATEQLEDALNGVNLQLAQEQGRLAAAAAGQFNLQNKSLFRAADQNRGAFPEARADLEAMRDRLVLNAQFQESQTKSSAMLDILAAKESMIESLRKSGAITDTEALKRTGDARAAQLDQLRSMADALAAVAQQTNKPEMLAAVEQFRARIDDLAASVDLVGQRSRAVFEDGLVGFLDASIGRTKSLKDALTSMFTDLGRQLLHLQNQDLARGLLGKGGAGGGGLMGAGGLVGLVTGLFGGGRGAEWSQAAQSSTASIFAGLYPSYDVGTDYVPRTGLALIHEGEKITPRNQRDDSGGVTIIQHNDFSGVDPMSVARIEAKLDAHTRATYQLVRDAQRRRVGG